MRRPEYDTVQDAARIAKINRHFVDWLYSWYTAELSELVYNADNAAQKQGRCQALKELHEFISKAPDMYVAKPDNRKPHPTHTDRSV